MLVVVGISLAWMVSRGLPSSVVYFITPTELVASGDDGVGARYRLGGLVAPGSVRQVGSEVRFILTDETSRVSVSHRGDTPGLFRAGIGVVLEGVYGKDGTFRSDLMMIKHSEEYRPPVPGETPGRSYRR